MGTDVHMYLEKKIEGKWVAAEPFTNTGRFSVLDVDPKGSIYHERNYLLFSVLAGLRTFPLNPGYWQKYEVKGFPQDADVQIKRVYDCYGSDAHSASSLTLKEIQNVDWAKEYIPMQFDVTERQKEIYEFCKKEHIEKYGKFVQGAWKLTKPFVTDYFLYDTIKSPWYSVLEALMPEDKRSNLSNVWALIPLNFACKDFYKNVIAKLETIAAKEGFSDDGIRLVFWFDN